MSDKTISWLRGDQLLTPKKLYNFDGFVPKEGLWFRDSDDNTEICFTVKQVNEMIKKGEWKKI